ncbi:MAG: metallophosphoesterase [Deltaproteobacteria bacterium]|jgi:predicted MPP superfamily phosphohydrolase|nr:metallophosphoesterase [Deltaproteobacteria bacterium]
MIRASLAILAFAIWYLPYRHKTLFKLKKAWPWSLALFVPLAGYAVTLMTGFYTSPNLAAQLMYNFFGLIFLGVIYLLPITLLGHLLSSFLKPLASKKAGVAQLLLAFGLVAYGWLNAQNFKITKYEIELPGLKKPVTIAHIPDVHLGAQRGERYLNQMVKAINENAPDLVIYNGDLVDSDAALRPELFELFRGVQAEQYFTTGNHEFYISTQRALELIAGAGIRILRSQAAQTHGLEIIGLEYMNGDRFSTDMHRVNDLYMDEELPKIPRSGLPTVLFHHSPVGLAEPPKNEIKVMLTGHTHGGQIFPVTWLIRYRFPYYKGPYELEGLTLLVSQGAGTFGPWARLGTFNELQLVKLVPPKAS